ncbi:MAG: gliding motility-associated ABC transporter ATP-binding subunit GldA [Bacteroidetes bacterium]|nr:MAG: gliding motility-associated ABC transporter ATP-binding subunit GldA [Bacteroidota bacterium]
MSIQISNITKYYGEQKVLDNVSLDVNSGEIVGLLGPNGAGKSTLMKIITCFIPPTSGEVIVNGFNIAKDSLEIKKQVGYLPEHNPLYTDMYIKEYLEFVCDIHHIPQKNKKIKEIIALTGLTKEQHKKIAYLSKGYRQRVGLAQALLPSPKVLILDEPTSGLDPNQLDEIRSLILKIGEEKTIFLSTHIMQEVEAVCDRVSIINNGKLVADENIHQLTKNTDEDALGIIFEIDQTIPKEWLLAIDGVKSVELLQENSWLIVSSSHKDIRKELTRLAYEKNLAILSLKEESNSLEQIFRKLTVKK